MIVPLLSLLGILQIPVINGFLPTSTPKCRLLDLPTSTTASTVETNSIIQPRRLTTSRLFVDLWDRMEIDEDEEPYWYLLNCVAGLEIDLLRQVRQISERKLSEEDVVKFVVPTVVKTRSHGANRMVRETKVKYLGYVFAKLRLTKETYQTIKNLDLCRSWMGTINIKGHKKLPPAPLPLGEEEIENFDLENPRWERDEQDEAPKKNKGIILDTLENDLKEREFEKAIEDEVKTVYKSLKVDDMIKVTAKNKFVGEDGIVKRLKEGMVKIRFFTYGQTFDEWLDPSEVRKLTDEEIEKGLGGPSAPITQRDLDGPQEREDKPQRKGGSDTRNSVGAFGGGPARERRQDRTERRFGGDGDEKKERDNWNWYKENEKRSQGGGIDDGDGVEIRAGSRSESKRGNDKGKSWAEGDVDSQWGRNNKDSRSEQKSRQEDDWSSFVSQAPSDGKTKPPKNAPSKEETDDFFASLMTDLSKDMDGNQGQRVGGKEDKPKESTSPADNDDDFFASLMSEIEDKPSGRTEQKPSTNKGNNGNDDDDDDFFASLEREIRGSTNSDKPSKPKSATDGQKASTISAPSSQEDDFFASLEMELASDLGEVKEERSESKIEVKASPASDDGSSEDDFFSSLEAELRSDLNEEETANDTIDAPAPVKKSSSPKKETNNIPTSASSFDATALTKRTVPQLKDILRDRGLKVSGKKAELIERITSGV